MAKKTNNNDCFSLPTREVDKNIDTLISAHDIAPDWVCVDQSPVSVFADTSLPDLSDLTISTDDLSEYHDIRFTLNPEMSIKIEREEGSDAFRHGELDVLTEFIAYLQRCYSKEHHYFSERQAIDAIDIWKTKGIMLPAASSNVDKYSLRFGKKEGQNPKDIMKILHYAILMLCALKDQEQETK